MKNTKIVGTTVFIGVIVFLLLVIAFQAGYLLKARALQNAQNEKNAIYQTPTASQTLPRKFQATSPFFNTRSDDWDPFQEMEDIQRKMNQMFQSSFGRSFQSDVWDQFSHPATYQPAMDVEDKGNYYLISLDLPGIDKDKINVQVQEGNLVISGQRETVKEKSQGDQYYQAERSFGSFSRTIPLPKDADTSSMDVQAEHGVITIKIPKLADTKSS